MAQRAKRSISLPPKLARDIERAAEREGMTVSAWLARTAARSLKIEAGLRAIDGLDLPGGPLTPDELAEGRAWARAILGAGRVERKRRSA